MLKESCKSVHICHSYGETSNVLFIESRCRTDVYLCLQWTWVSCFS